MSAADTGLQASRDGLEEQGLALLRWRREASQALASFRRWAILARLIDENTAARLAHLERRFTVQRVELVLLGREAQAKCNLVNAMLAGRLAARFLPSVSGSLPLCPLAIVGEPGRTPSLRLLPIETREDERSLREHLQDVEHWKELALDAAQPSTFAPVLEALSETLHVTSADAATLGFVGEGAGRVEVPRWRFAIANVPHPMLEAGVAILLAPDAGTLEREPELARNRVPDADALAFVVGVDAGPPPDAAAVEAFGEDSQVRVLVVDIGDPPPDALGLARLREAAGAWSAALGVDSARVVECSPAAALRALESGDARALAASRLPALETVLARIVLRRRRDDDITTLRAETRSLLSESRAILDGRGTFMGEQLQELEALKGKNQKLIETLARKGTAERKQLDQARQAMVGLRGVQNRHAEELAALLDPKVARDEAIRAREAVEATAFGRGIGEVLDVYFMQNRQRLERAIAVIDEVQRLMATVGRKFDQDFGIRTDGSTEFATGRFRVEFDRLEAQAARDLRTPGARLARRASLATAFHDTIGLKVLLVYEIADREVRAWMAAFIRPLETQLSALQERAGGRLDSIGKVESAEGDLVDRMGELRKLLADVETQGREWEEQYAQFTRLLGSDPGSLRVSGSSRPAG